MALMKPSEDWAVTAEQAAQRKEYGYSGRSAVSELRLRNAIEALLRQRYPMARLCHEMVMGEREVRADVVAVDTAHIAAVEVKGEGDNVTRLLHQVGMFQLCVPEVWVVTAKQDHREAAKLINFLMPSVGVIEGTGLSDRWDGNRHHSAVDDPCELTVVAEAVPRRPHPEMMSQMLWAKELANIVTRKRLMAFPASRLPSRAKMIAEMLSHLSDAELMAETCTELRARHALWRADPPVRGEKHG